LKKIGIIGGLGPEPTVEYYKIITAHFHGKPEGSPRIIIYSLDVDELRRLFEAERWDDIVSVLMEGVTSLHRAGADFGLIAANTPHLVFGELERVSPIPLLSIVTQTFKVIKEKGLSRVGLLGTSFTMRSTLFQKELDPEGIEVLVPEEAEIDYIQMKIFEELAVGRFLDETRNGFLDIVKRLIDRHGIEGVILGCTEIPLLLTEDAFGIPFLDTTKIHAESAIRYCID
jgi:aspartate racemase